MPTLTEQAVCTSFIGKTIHTEHLIKCARRNHSTEYSDEYIVYSCLFLYNQELRERFGVTAKLKDLWERRGTEFNVYIYISDHRLVSSRILKYTESGGARPSMTTPKCTQQELRIARRILEYLVEA